MRVISVDNSQFLIKINDLVNSINLIIAFVIHTARGTCTHVLCNAKLNKKNKGTFSTDDYYWLIINTQFTI